MSESSEERRSAAAGITALVEWAAATRWHDIPAPMRRRIAFIVGDNLAANLAAADEPQLRAAHERMVARRVVQEATIFRSGAPRVSTRNAAIANGLAATWAELDDGYSKAPSHPGAYSQSALLAVAETEGASLEATLRAALLAYEIGARIASTWRSVVPPVHPHALYNAPCAAAAVGLVRGYDARTLLAAISGAVTLVSPGPFAHATEGALVRNGWPAAGAINGMLACEWAECGIGGIAESAYDVYAGSFGAATDAEQLSAGLGHVWAVGESYHKRYACCQQAHAAIEALESLVATRPDLRTREDIERVVVAVPEVALHLDAVRPPTTLAAKFSLPHALAGALVYGATNPAAFSAASLDDARVARLRDRVQLIPYADVKPWPLDRPGRVRVLLSRGEPLDAACEAALGSPSRPLDEATILAKIAALGAPAVPRLADAIARLADDAAADADRCTNSTADWIRSTFA